MMRSLNSAVSGLQGFQERMDVIGNNIANVNTVGYKAARTEFSDSFSQTLKAASGSTTAAGGSSPMQIGTGVGVSSVRNLFTQGAMSRTGVVTDLAISGEGFFVVADPLTGAQYATRDGEFRRDSEGYLVSSSGMRIQGFNDSSLSVRGDLKIDYPDAVTPGNFQVNGHTVEVSAGDTLQAVFNRIASATNTDVTGNIVDGRVILTSSNPITLTAGTSNFLEKAQLDATGNTGTVTSSAAVGDVMATISSMTIDSDGKINIKLSDGRSLVRGQVLMQRFNDPQALVKEGDNLYSNLQGAGALGGTTPLAQAAGTNGLGTIQSGAVELSSVDLTNEFASLITTQRAFQASARIITTADEMMQETVNLKR